VEHSIIVQGNGGVLLSATVANGDIASLTANGEGIKLGDIKVDLKSIAGALAEAFPNGTKPAVAAPPRTQVTERTPPPAKAPGRKATAKKAAKKAASRPAETTVALAESRPLPEGFSADWDQLGGDVAALMSEHGVGKAQVLAWAREAGKAAKATKAAKAPAKKAAPGVNNAIRDWAASKGMKVSDRGRISREVQDAYNAAHNLA
jgi:hypothetical protein